MRTRQQWQDVHLRLLSQLPVRTHTKAVAPPTDIASRPQGRAWAMWRRGEIRRMHAEGMTVKAMAAELDITDCSVRQHLYAIEAGG